MNQLYADPNNRLAMCIYVPNSESLNAMPMSARFHHLVERIQGQHNIHGHID